MNKIIATLLLLLSSQTFAAYPDNKLDPDLLSVFNKLVSPRESSKLIGKKFRVVLSLKYASKKHLLFHDAYIKVNEREKYQIAKWKFMPSVVAGVEGKFNIECMVEFVVNEIQTEGAYKNMPHLVVEVIKINV